MPREINPCGKIRPVETPYEIWLTSDLQWRWLVLGKYLSPKKEKNNPSARWYCAVSSPIICNEYEIGDAYKNYIMLNAYRMLGWNKHAPLCFECAERMGEFGEPFLHITKHSVENDYFCTRCGKKLVDVQPSGGTLIQLGVRL